MKSALSTLWILLLGCVASLATSIPLPPEDDTPLPGKNQNKDSDKPVKSKQGKTSKTDLVVSTTANVPKSDFLNLSNSGNGTLPLPAEPTQSSDSEVVLSKDDTINIQEEPLEEIDDDDVQEIGDSDGSEEEDNSIPDEDDNEEDDEDNDEEDDDEEDENSGNYYLRLYMEEQKRSRAPIRLPWE